MLEIFQLAKALAHRHTQKFRPLCLAVAVLNISGCAAYYAPGAGIVIETGTIEFHPERLRRAFSFPPFFADPYYGGGGYYAPSPYYVPYQHAPQPYHPRHRGIIFEFNQDESTGVPMSSNERLSPLATLALHLA